MRHVIARAVTHKPGVKGCCKCMQAAAEVQEFVQEMLRCHKLPHDQKPSLQLWHDSPHAPRLLALQAFALDRADTADSTLAIQMMQVIALLHCPAAG